MVQKKDDYPYANIWKLKAKKKKKKPSPTTFFPPPIKCLVMHHVKASQIPNSHDPTPPP